jgi:cobalt-zinc-cadmium efflux system membrane fusion protein
MHGVKKSILYVAAVVVTFGCISAASAGGDGKHGAKQEKGTQRSQKTEARAHKATHEEKEHDEEKHVKLGEAEMRGLGIEVATAGSGTMGRELSLPGEIVINSDRAAHIVPRVPGVVREVRKTLGDSVRQGEVLAVIDSRELAKAKAEYLAAVEKVSLAEAKYVREESLWKKKISAEMDYLDARQAWAEAKITLRAEEQKLHSLGFSHDYLKRLPRMPDEEFTRFEIVAPFDGTVIERHITRGEVVKDETDVFQIADLSSVWVNISVYQKDFQVVRKGQSVIISTGHDGNSAKAEIAFVSPLVKEETRTALARVILPNPAGTWRPGTFVNVRLTVAEFSVPVAVPKSALLSLEDKTVVFIQDKDGFEARPVKVGRTTDEQAEILSGLSPGEQFVAKGVFTLKSELKKETLQVHEH